jgi:hypothetical protein
LNLLGILFFLQFQWSLKGFRDFLNFCEILRLHVSTDFLLRCFQKLCHGVVFALRNVEEAIQPMLKNLLFRHWE